MHRVSALAESISRNRSAVTTGVFVEWKLNMHRTCRGPGVTRSQLHSDGAVRFIGLPAQAPADRWPTEPIEPNWKFHIRETCSTANDLKTVITASLVDSLRLIILSSYRSPIAHLLSLRWVIPPLRRGNLIRVRRILPGSPEVD